MRSIVTTMANWRSSNTQSPPLDLCEICGKKPKFVENGIKHSFCSRTCARKGQGPTPAVCILQGCHATGKPAFANFCSETHAKEGVRRGITPGCDGCSTQPRAVDDLCITCDRVARTESRTRELKADGSTFKNIRTQFLSEWESSGTMPSIEKVYEVIVPRDVRARHDTYRSKSRNNEEIRTFHSSQCICNLGSTNLTLCMFKSCGICCIVKTSFKDLGFGVAFNNGRFGDGIYSYRNPAQADKFATSSTSSPYRVMIACDVVVESGQSLSDDDNVPVFSPNADAILPAYIIMYTK